MMKNNLPIKKTVNLTFIFERFWRAFFGRGKDFPNHYEDRTFVSTP